MACSHPYAQAGKPTSKGTVYTYCPDCGAVKKDAEPWHSCAMCLHGLHAKGSHS